MPDTFSRVERVVLSLHSAAQHVETIEVLAPNILDGTVYVFFTADGRTIYGWISVNELGDGSVLISNAQPGTFRSPGV